MFDSGSWSHSTVRIGYQTAYLDLHYLDLTLTPIFPAIYTDQFFSWVYQSSQFPTSDTVGIYPFCMLSDL